MKPCPIERRKEVLMVSWYRGAVDNLCDSLYSPVKSSIRIRQLVEIKCLCGHDPGLRLDPLETPRGVLAENRTPAVFALRDHVRRIK